MKPIHEILKLVDFGSDVAENDPGLMDYFVETSDFETILTGSVDVIRGHKGLGKSAIYRTLLSGRYTPANTILASASEATSSDLFRATQTVNKTEDQFKLLWTAYLGATIANELLAVMPETPHDKDDLKQVRDFLKHVGLLRANKSPSLLDAVRRTKGFGIGLGVSEEGLPSLTFSVDLDKETERVLVSEEHFLRLIDLCVGILRNNGKKLWILIDRLDELFPKGTSNEIHSLRALFRSHLSICAVRQGQTEARPKIFIRTDIYDRITRQAGFTNVTHFRDLNIVWNAKSMVALVTRRVIANATVEVKLKRMQVDTEDPTAIWDALAPVQIQSQRSHTWIAKATTDSSGAFNPRNYITILSLAAKRNLELLRVNPMGSYGDTMLSSDAIVSAFGELSRKRLDDTILAEFPDCRSFVDHLRGGLASFDSKEALASAIGIDQSKTAEIEAAIDLLVDCGVLRRLTFSTFSIAYLYRPALRAGNRERSNQNDIG